MKHRLFLGKDDHKGKVTAPAPVPVSRGLLDELSEGDRDRERIRDTKKKAKGSVQGQSTNKKGFGTPR